MNKTISVIGAGTAGCFSAMYFAKKYPHIQLDWVVKTLTGNIGVGEATVPAVQHFLTDLGYDIDYIINKCNGSLKLGVEFRKFSNKNFWHPFGNTTQEQQELMYIAGRNKIPDNMLEYDDIATHFDVSMLIRDFYNTLSSLPNVNIIENHIPRDINIMCTGFETPDKENYTPANKLMNNQAYVHRSKFKDYNDKVPYTKCTAGENGWMWKIPLGDTVTHGYVNNGHVDCYDEYIEYLNTQSIDINQNNIRKISFHCGRLNKHIQEDKKSITCRVGLSSCFLEPMEATGLYFIVNSINTLDRFLNNEISSDEFNNIVNYDFDTIYNFILAHYTGSTNTNEYWTQCKSVPFERHTNSIFPDSSWDYILNGLREGTSIELPEHNPSLVLNNKTYKQWCAERI